MGVAPKPMDSTPEERRAYIKDRFPCIADCDLCGVCRIFRGKDPETAYADYIRGEKSSRRSQGITVGSYETQFDRYRGIRFH